RRSASKHISPLGHGPVADVQDRELGGIAAGHEVIGCPSGLGERNLSVAQSQSRPRSPSNAPASSGNCPRNGNARSWLPVSHIGTHPVVTALPAAPRPGAVSASAPPLLPPNHCAP